MEIENPLQDSPDYKSYEKTLQTEASYCQVKDHPPEKRSVEKSRSRSPKNKPSPDSQEQK